MRTLRVAIATNSRFWVLDLARELAALDHDVSFWSHVPRRHTERYGLPPATHRSLLPRLLPLVLAQRFGGARLSEWANREVLVAADRVIARRLEPCDVFIGMSGLSVESARAARERYGATVFIERGSRHVQSQKAILDDLRRRGMPAVSVPDYYVDRELQGYALADRVVIPARHVEQSFVERGFPAEKLFRNPYGVDLSMFPPTPPPLNGPPTLLFVGAWSFRKGVDVLEAAWRKLVGVNLLHVGPVADAPLPTAPGFTHVDAVPQRSLRDYYAQAHLFVMASREEGLALVQAQALACGLPLVCTDYTGGHDLQSVLDDPGWVHVVPSDDADALADGIRAMLPKALKLQGERNLLRAGRDKLSWAAYGRRYAAELARVVS
ncbi:MAG TPA: glycosyltransferase family 4 protein [Chloroflexia bacterium]|nr:glycosyltransferase family 4 protein [Chloroflexia bacterium]